MIGTLIKAARQARKLTKKQVGEASVSTIATFKPGKPDAATLVPSTQPKRPKCSSAFATFYPSHMPRVDQLGYPDGQEKIAVRFLFDIRFPCGTHRPMWKGKCLFSSDG